MSVIIKDACKFINGDNFAVEDIVLSLDKPGEALVYIKNITDSLLYDIEYKTGNSKIRVTGPKALPSYHKAHMVISWDKVDEGDSFYLDVTSKVK